MNHFMIDSGDVWMAVLEPSPQEAAELITGTPERQDEILTSLMPNASEADAAACQAVCDKRLPPGAVRLTCNVYMPSENGLLNCRINGQHKQIRF